MKKMAFDHYDLLYCFFFQFASFVLSVKYGGKYVFIHSFHPRGGLPGQGGGARRKFWNGPLRGAKILFCGRGLKVFSPHRDTNPQTTH